MPPGVEEPGTAEPGMIEPGVVESGVVELGIEEGLPFFMLSLGNLSFLGADVPVPSVAGAVVSVPVPLVPLVPLGEVLASGVVVAGAV